MYLPSGMPVLCHKENITWYVAAKALVMSLMSILNPIRF